MTHQTEATFCTVQVLLASLEFFAGSEAVVLPLLSLHCQRRSSAHQFSLSGH